MIISSLRFLSKNAVKRFVGGFCREIINVNGFSYQPFTLLSDKKIGFVSSENKKKRSRPNAFLTAKPKNIYSNDLQGFAAASSANFWASAFWVLLGLTTSVMQDSVFEIFETTR